MLLFNIDNLIQQFLVEDIGQGDITSESIFDENEEGVGLFIAKESFICAGMEHIGAKVFQTLNQEIVVEHVIPDSVQVSPGDRLLTVSGPVIDLLRGERVALNLVQRVSGVATLTAEFISAVKGLPVQIVDTRKTTPGLRVLEKYGVRVGGGHNHRFNLADGVLIKDNHIAACGSVKKAVEKVRQRVPHTIKIEVETENTDQIQECIDCGVEIIMLDNMDTPAMLKAVKLIAGRALVEASGGVTLDTVRDIAETGVDIISIGRLTHSAPACDISMDIEPL